MERLNEQQIKEKLEQYPDWDLVENGLETTIYDTLTNAEYKIYRGNGYC